MISLFLIPSALHWNDVFSYSGLSYIPGGNEKNLQIWLYENVENDDLILNDPSYAAIHFPGFRSVELVNNYFQPKMNNQQCHTIIDWYVNHFFTLNDW